MRIAQIAPLYESVPPRLYGGTERVVAHLAAELIRQGHHVTLFASGDSLTEAKLVPCRDTAIRLDPSPSADVAAHLVMLEEVRRRAHEFDILHFHTDFLHMPLFRDVADKTVTTLHGRLDIKDLGPFFRHFPQFHLVSISDAQRKPLRDVRWAATVHHGYPVDQYSFTANPQGGYLAFLGRICPEKRPDRAIEIARRAGLPLRIAAKVDAADRAYFKQVIEPLLDDPLVDFVGEISDLEKSAFLGNALALLFPIDWPEPFGLVMIEAMACGTPVIAWNHGSVPEVLEDGVTGRIVDGMDAAVNAVKGIEALDRARVRRRFEERFTVEAMTRGYLDVYEYLLSKRKQDRVRVAATRPAASAIPTVGPRNGNGRLPTIPGGAKEEIHVQ